MAADRCGGRREASADCGLRIEDWGGKGEGCGMKDEGAEGRRDRGAEGAVVDGTVGVAKHVRKRCNVRTVRPGRPVSGALFCRSYRRKRPALLGPRGHHGFERESTSVQSAGQANGRRPFRSLPGWDGDEVRPVPGHCVALGPSRSEPQNWGLCCVSERGTWSFVQSGIGGRLQVASRRVAPDLAEGGVPVLAFR